MLIDLHLHTTRYSPGCSVMEPWDLVPAAKSMGLDGVAITDHNCCWEAFELKSLQGQGVFVATGREVDCGRGLHVLVYGLRGALPESKDAVSFARQVHERGGATILAHPFRFGKWREKTPQQLEPLWKAFHAVEACSGSHALGDSHTALQACVEMGVTASGGSDAHAIKDLGRYATRFNSAISSEAELVEAIRAGDLSPVNGRS